MKRKRAQNARVHDTRHPMPNAQWNGHETCAELSKLDVSQKWTQAVIIYIYIYIYNHFSDLEAEPMMVVWQSVHEVPSLGV